MARSLAVLSAAVSASAVISILGGDASAFVTPAVRTNDMRQLCRTMGSDHPCQLAAVHNGGDDSFSVAPPLGIECRRWLKSAEKNVMSSMAGIAIVAACVLPSIANAENELADKYGNGKSFDSSLVDQTCLVDKCSLQAKACLADDPSCRKGLTCTAKCMGDNTCITGCMARYGDKQLDNLLKCTIEDNECIKIAILDGGSDKFGEEPRPPAPTVPSFNMRTMEGTWYKVAGFNPNYDCYACQRNTFSKSTDRDALQVDVEFSMPRMMPDGTPPPPKNEREVISYGEKGGLMYGSQSIGFNEYSTHEKMVFDQQGKSKLAELVMNKGKENEASYARTAHSEGEMFGLKFWENWYVIGENDPGQPDFKFVFYNGKTRQNTYEGAFVYSRTRDLDPTAMKKVYQIASDAGMNPDQFCKIRNTCFADDGGATPDVNGNKRQGPEGPFRGILASTKVSELLGVDSVAAAEGNMLKRAEASAAMARSSKAVESTRPWWYEVGDYTENPNRHFEAMNSLRLTMDWPEDVKSSSSSQEAAATVAAPSVK